MVAMLWLVNKIYIWLISILIEGKGLIFIKNKNVDSLLPYRMQVWQIKKLLNFICQTICSSTTIIGILTFLPNFSLTKLLSYTVSKTRH